MKELSIEEKAQRYDEALGRTRKLYDSNTNEGFRRIFEDIFYELAESEDERILNCIRICLTDVNEQRFNDFNTSLKDCLAWLKKQGNKDEEILVLKDQIESLHAAIKAIKETHRIKLEKQDEHQKFIDAIQIGDKITRNEDGVLVNLSQLNRVAKKQGEQKPDTDFSDLRTWKYIVDAVWTEKEGIGQYLDSPFTEEVAKRLQKRFGNIEQKSNELPNGEDYGIDGLYHAIHILEETLGKVDGYQTDDGILEHKCAINAVKELYEQKPAEYTLEQAAGIFLDALSNTPYNNKPITDAQVITKELLKFLEDTSSYNPNAINEQKPADKVEPKFKKGDVIRRKDGDGLEWTVEDLHKDGYYTIVNSDRDDFVYLDDNWELVEQKSTWSEEDDRMCKDIIDNIQAICEEGYFVGNIGRDKLIAWLKFLKQRYTWKPTEEQMAALLVAVGDEKKLGSDAYKELYELYLQLKNF